MLPIATFHSSSPTQSKQSDPPLVRRRTDPRSSTNQHERALTANSTIDANASTLILEPLPRDHLYLLPAAIATYLLRQARRGYCPPLPALRRLGFRTRREMEAAVDRSVTHSSLAHD